MERFSKATFVLFFLITTSIVWTLEPLIFYVFSSEVQFPFYAIILFTLAIFAAVKIRRVSQFFISTFVLVWLSYAINFSWVEFHKIGSFFWPLAILYSTIITAALTLAWQNIFLRKRTRDGKTLFSAMLLLFTLYLLEAYFTIHVGVVPLDPSRFDLVLVYIGVGEFMLRTIGINIFYLDFSGFVMTMNSLVLCVFYIAFVIISRLYKLRTKEEIDEPVITV